MVPCHLIVLTFCQLAALSIHKNYFFLSLGTKLLNKWIGNKLEKGMNETWSKWPRFFVDKSVWQNGELINWLSTRSVRVWDAPLSEQLSDNDINFFIHEFEISCYYFYPCLVWAMKAWVEQEWCSILLGGSRPCSQILV